MTFSLAKPEEQESLLQVGPKTLGGEQENLSSRHSAGHTWVLHLLLLEYITFSSILPHLFFTHPERTGPQHFLAAQRQVGTYSGNLMCLSPHWMRHLRDAWRVVLVVQSYLLTSGTLFFLVSAGGLLKTNMPYIKKVLPPPATMLYNALMLDCSLQPWVDIRLRNSERHVFWLLEKATDTNREHLLLPHVNTGTQTTLQHTCRKAFQS